MMSLQPKMSRFPTPGWPTYNWWWVRPRPLSIKVVNVNICELAAVLANAKVCEVMVVVILERWCFLPSLI